MPIRIDGTDITGATIDGTDVQEITVDGQTVFSAQTLPVAYSNLVAWYPFDSATYGGSNADDVTAIIGGSGDDTAYNLTANGTPQYQSSAGVTDIRAGANSGAFDFNGNSNFRGDTFSIPTTQCFWVNIQNQGSQYLNYWDSGDQTSFIYDFNTNQLEWFNAISRTTLRTVSTPTGYIHCAFTVDSNGFLSVYVDGQLELSGSTNLSSGLVRVGASENETDPTNGFIDDFRVYNTDLSASQVNQIIQNTPP